MKKYLPLILCGLSMIGCNSLPNEMQLVKKGDTIAPRYFNLEEAVGVNELLVNFPNTIPGAESIEKYLTPDAKYCLIHIRQSHLIKNPSKKDLKEIKKVQDNIYDTLSYLVENYNVDKIYDEGLTPGLARVKNFCADLGYALRNPKNLIFEIKKPNTDNWVPVNTEDIEKLKKENPEIYEVFSFFQEELEYDAAYKLATETGKIEIMAAEDPNKLREASYMYNRLRGLGAFRWITERKRSFNAIHENRENNFLEIASKQNFPLVVVVYGAHHALGGEISCGRNYFHGGKESIEDNIAKWNFNNPNNKFSLIEISPFGL